MNPFTDVLLWVYALQLTNTTLQEVSLFSIIPGILLVVVFCLVIMQEEVEPLVLSPGEIAVGCQLSYGFIIKTGSPPYAVLSQAYCTVSSNAERDSPHRKVCPRWQQQVVQWKELARGTAVKIPPQASSFYDGCHKRLKGAFEGEFETCGRQVSGTLSNENQRWYCGDCAKRLTSNATKELEQDQSEKAEPISRSGIQMEDAGVSCSVCFESFREEDRFLPRLLSCGHSFCEKCLSQLPLSSTSAIACPKCRHETSVPKGDVKVLPRNFDLLEMISQETRKRTAVKRTRKKCDNCREAYPNIEPLRDAGVYCMTCAVFLCEDCDGEIHKLGVLKKHSRLDAEKAPPAKAQCTAHPGSLLEYWCPQDGVAVCTVCCLAGAHHGHKVQTLEESWHKVKRDAEGILEAVECAIRDVEMVVKRQQQVQEQRQQAVAVATEAISLLFNGLKEVVENRQRHVLQELQDWERVRHQNNVEKESQLLEAITKLKAIGKQGQYVMENETAWLAQPVVFEPRKLIDDVQGVKVPTLLTVREDGVLFEDIGNKNSAIRQLLNTIGDLRMSEMDVPFMCWLSHPFINSNMHGGGWQLLLKAGTGIELGGLSDHWIKASTLHADKAVDLDFLSDPTTSCKTDHFNSLAVEELLLLRDSENNANLNNKHQPLFVHLRLPERKPLLQFFQASNAVRLTLVDGTADPLALAGQPHQKFYSPEWRLNSKSSGNAAYCRIGGWFAKQWASYGEDECGACSAEWAGIGLHDAQWGNFLQGSKGFGIRIAHDQPGNMAASCLVFGR